VDVAFGKFFKKTYVNLPESDKRKIYDFVEHVRHRGMIGLEGRNKNSDAVDKNDPEFLLKVRYAIAHRLWHYHIGILEYDCTRPFGERTSEWILHYMNNHPHLVRIVDMDRHPPFRLPEKESPD